MPGMPGKILITAREKRRLELRLMGILKISRGLSDKTCIILNKLTMFRPLMEKTGKLLIKLQRLKLNHRIRGSNASKKQKIQILRYLKDAYKYNK
jgi:hypothetical protein